MADEKPPTEAQDTPKQPIRRGVMDVQRPRGQQPLAPRPTVAPTRAVETPAPVTEVSPPAVSTTPATPLPTKPTIVEQASEALASEQSADTTHHPQQEMLAAHATKKGRPMAVIVVAILIALVMAGLTVFAYMKTKDSTPTKPSADQSSHQSDASTQTQGASVTDVDNTTKEIDAATTGDEATDIPQSDLSDQTLGL